MKTIVRIVSLATVFLAPALVFAQPYTSVFGFGNCTGTVECLANTVINLINGVLVPVLFAVAFIVFLYGIAQTYIFSHGEPGKVSEGHKTLLWGIIGFVVMILLWGLVNVVANTFGLYGSFAPEPPKSYSPTSLPRR